MLARRANETRAQDFELCIPLSWSTRQNSGIDHVCLPSAVGGVQPVGSLAPTWVTHRSCTGPPSTRSSDTSAHDAVRPARIVATSPGHAVMEAVRGGQDHAPYIQAVEAHWQMLETMGTADSLPL